MEQSKISAVVYKAIRGMVKLCYPKLKVTGVENLPKEAAIVVGNHAQMHGPITAELFFPGKRRTWCAGEMMKTKEVPDYAFNDFWKRKPKYIRWFYRLLSYIIAPISSCIFNNASIIGVYHDARVISTFRSTVSSLQDGISVIIFPEKDEPYNNILYKFEERFVDTARMLYCQTGKALEFVPMYIAPKLKLMCIGKPVRFDPEAPIAEERSRICACIMERITALAKELPVHTVVPYRNIPKRLYPLSCYEGIDA